MENSKLIKQLNNIILEAKIVGMTEQEDKFGYADTKELDKLLIDFLKNMNIEKVTVMNGYVYLANGGNLN